MYQAPYPKEPPSKLWPLWARILFLVAIFVLPIGACAVIVWLM